MSEQSPQGNPNIVQFTIDDAMAMIGRKEVELTFMRNQLAMIESKYRELEKKLNDVEVAAKPPE